MKSNLFLLIFVAVMLFSFFPIEAENDENIEISILSLEKFSIDDDYNNEYQSFFVFTAVVQINNPAENNITINHSDTCGFKLEISYQEHDRWQSSQLSLCGAAITPEIFQPGLTNRSAQGGINFNDVYSTPPEGKYTISIRYYNEQRQAIINDFEFVIEAEAIRLNSSLVSSNAGKLPFPSISFFVAAVFLLMMIPKIYHRK